MSKDAANHLANQRAPLSTTFNLQPQPGGGRAGMVNERERKSDGLATAETEGKSVQKKTGAPLPPKVQRSLSMSLTDGYNPPNNFANVANKVYRSSFPKPDNFAYLKKLGLKSILTLVPEEYPADNVQFMRQSGITHFQIPMPGNKEPFVNIPDEAISAALRVIIDPRNHPILVHCNKGKHRTGCVIGCLRKFQGWSLTHIFDEYRRFAAHKSRPLDQLKIELYDMNACWNLAKNHGWIPLRLVREAEEEAAQEDDDDDDDNDAIEPAVTAGPVAAIRAQ